ncbi:MAG TPA: prolyl oligopeptidase family serine peptidase [Candidatus Tumulicola sp.]|jgi:prolyl oligopeptidase
MMRVPIAAFAIAVCLSSQAALAAAPAGSANRLAYPPPPSDGTVNTYYGTQVADPYRPLESIDAPTTRAWVEAESALARSYLDAIPQRAAIASHLQSIVNYERYGLPFHMRDQYFYLYNSGLQNQSVLYTMRGIHGVPRVLIDPNALSTDGSVTIGGESPSWNARFLAYSTQSSGSDWQTWHVRDVATGKDLPDTLQWSKFASAAWLPDDNGFFYERYPVPSAGETYKGALYDHAVYFHKLGTPESDDPRFYYRPEDKNWLYGTQVTEDGRYLVLTVSANTSINTRIGYVDLRDPKRTVRELLWKNDAQWNYVANAGPIFYFTSTLNAPNSRVVTVDVRRPQKVQTVVAQGAFALQAASLVGKRLILSYLADAHSAVKIYDERGRFVRNVGLPGLGDATGFGGFSTDRSTFYTYAGWTTPPTTYLYDVASGTSSVYRKPRIAFDPSEYATDEVFYRSKDGTRVPMTISYRKGTPFDGSAPTILYGYGGFDIPMTPYFSTAIATWLQMGGVYAVANIRGGSEYGEAWHRGGMLGHKQNVFDDFIAAAEYLIARNYTSTPKLAIKGESNGGLLIGAVETQRPDLFGAAVPGVGVLDMLRFDKFTIGNFWIPEYGCSTCDQSDFEWLAKYSPYANVRPNTTYPPTLIMTSDHDDRVFPAHSFKFAAKMQADQAGSAPILLRVQLKAGHGGSTTLAQSIDSTADIYAFLVKSLQMELPANFGSAGGTPQP